jgi:hypothetical protein
MLFKGYYCVVFDKFKNYHKKIATEIKNLISLQSQNWEMRK